MDPAVRPPGSDWTAREIAGHLLTVLHRYVRRESDPEGRLGATPRDVDRLNAADLAALGDVPVSDLCGRIEAEVRVIRDRLGPERADLRQRLPFHGGIAVDGAAALANIAAEFLIHGRDVALAAGRPWPLAERDAVLILNGVMQILPGYARRDAAGALSLRLRVPGAAAWLVEFRDGHAASRPALAGDHADVVVRVPAVTLLLLLYSRLTPLAAVRTGMLVTGGRRPWRAARLPRLLERP